MSMMDISSTGMKVQQANMDIHSGNIANAKTDGFMPEIGNFKTQVFGNTNSVMITPSNTFYMEGPVAMTDNTLDLAVDGPGFLVVQFSDGMAFKKSVRGELDKTGNYLDESGNKVMGIPLNPLTGEMIGGLNAGSFQPIKIDMAGTNATATTTGTMEFNLPADAKAAAGGAAATKTQITQLPVFDSLGLEHQVQITWTKTNDAARTWTGVAAVMADVPGGAVPGTVAGGWAGAGFTLTFDANGQLGAGAIPNLQINAWNNAAANSDITMTLPGVTMLGNAFNVTKIDADGSGLGTYTATSVGKDGVVSVRYSNGKEKPLFKIALAAFPAVNQLKRQSNNLLLQTPDSGNAQFAESGQGRVGNLMPQAIVNSATDMMGSQIETLESSQIFNANAGVFDIGRKCGDTINSLLRG